MAISKDEFRAALARFPSGVTVVTTRDARGKFYGITVSAFSSVSLAPPLVLVCIDRETGTHFALSESEHFAVHILAEGQEKVSNRFASRLEEKFSGIDYRLGIEGVPVLTDSVVALECRVAHRHEGGDHTIFVGEIERAEIRDEKPLVYWHGDYRKLKLD